MQSPVNVKVGENYIVPCVRINNDPFLAGQILPIILPAHEDGPEHCLREASSHYHIDFRFCDLHHANGSAGWLSSHCSAPFKHKMKAIRDYTNSLVMIGESAFFMVNRWYRNNHNRIATNGRCLHKNAMLVNACGTCPFHGLQWDLKSGRLADFKLPFYLELANREIQNPHNPRAPIIGDSCEIKIASRFDHDGTVIMVDDNHKRYGLMKQQITPKHLEPGDRILFDTETLCAHEN